jgi:hypothetical protein
MIDTLKTKQKSFSGYFLLDDDYTEFLKTTKTTL